ncbi:hypothetical protein COU78_01450 [Candidatus Peregrinibacteria bacterium CG10_big_fil_rev_8_21_14_0_10_49_24]|nr:MAG: hypothetical protein COV83_04415 [Candidatus Peregrinibacteria bacterium CG11_big_fil_rev_8_21_14_0_20_49_14]PIR51390.1 MAG: hypothetical protein COU78_01450 [Candidatus Peregrinibacteria bacterium CG10_big_fil_rev_8_21_14_0_10_49_24]PJA68154.1 MAG: hypothetical protein CO157_01265 [Candidatus Peregrinibacteria bacterium CG_4_9_14_3_um_filter_49_12]
MPPVFLLQPSIFVWDLTIALLIAVALSVCLVCILCARRKKARPILAAAISAVGIVSFCIGATVVYGSFVEPRMIRVTQYSVNLPVSEPLKIAVVSDLHVGPYKGIRFTEQLVRTINNTLPDIVLLVGDFLYADESDFSALAPLADIRASLGVFGVLGNHDQGEHATIFGTRYSTLNRGEDIAAELERLGVHMLRNQHSISRGVDTLAIAGIDDLWTGDADLDAAFDQLPENVTTILLSHNPDVIEDSRSARADLIVSGHTHGGQIRLPFLGPIRPMPIRISQKYDQGLFTTDPSTQLAITRGVGETWARARLLAWPEVLILDAS